MCVRSSFSRKFLVVSRHDRLSGRTRSTIVSRFYFCRCSVAVIANQQYSSWTAIAHPYIIDERIANLRYNHIYIVSLEPREEVDRNIANRIDTNRRVQGVIRAFRQDSRDSDIHWRSSIALPHCSIPCLLK